MPVIRTVSSGLQVMVSRCLLANLGSGISNLECPIRSDVPLFADEYPHFDGWGCHLVVVYPPNRGLKIL